ncbi:MAG: CopG family transcriptional regulator [Panacagrimonas sp.]
MIRTQISFDKALYERAKRSARRQGVSLAELCRRSVAAAVAQEPSEQPWMAFIGSVDGSLDDSSSVDAVVYGRDAP